MARSKAAGNQKAGKAKQQKQGKPQQRTKQSGGVNKRTEAKRAAGAQEALSSLGSAFFAEASAELAERGIKVRTAKERRRADGGAAGPKPPSSALGEEPTKIVTPAAAAPPPLDPATLLSGWSIK